MIFRPSLEEARTELASLIDPALDAGLGGAPRPEGFAEGSSCDEPIIGPADGIRPTLTYTFSFSILGGDPEAFLNGVEDHWRSEGLRIDPQDTETARFLYSGRDGYSLRAAIVYASKEAVIGGSGPCVDNPDPD